MQNPQLDVRTKISSFSRPSLAATLRFTALWFHLSKMLQDEFPEAIPCRTEPAGAALQWPAGGQRLPSPLPLPTSSPSRSGAGTPRAAPESASPSAQDAARRGWGWGWGQSRARQEEGRGGAAPPGTGISRCCGVRSGLALRLAPAASPAAPDSAGGSAGAGGMSGRTAPWLRALPGWRAGGGCPDRLHCPQAQDLLPTGRGLSEEPRTGVFTSLPGHRAGGRSSAFLKGGNSAKRG